MRSARQELVLDIVRHGWVQAHRRQRWRFTLVCIRRGLAALALLASVALFVVGLVERKQHTDDAAGAGAHVVPAQHAMPIGGADGQSDDVVHGPQSASGRGGGA